MEKDYNYSPYMNYGSSSSTPNTSNDDFNPSAMYSDPVLNPIMQYEQAYTYYRFLCMQMDYKIKCKEYEKMCGIDKSVSNNSTVKNNATSQHIR